MFPLLESVVASAKCRKVRANPTIGMSRECHNIIILYLSLCIHIDSGTERPI